MQDKINYLASMMTEQQQARLIAENLGCQTNLDAAHAIVKEGKKYTRVDIGRLDDQHRSGKLMIDESGEIYGIKAYGVINRGHHYGNLDTVDDWYWGFYFPIKKEHATAYFNQRNSK